MQRLAWLAWFALLLAGCSEVDRPDAPAPPPAAMEQAADDSTVTTREEAARVMREQSRIVRASGIGPVSREIHVGERMVQAEKEFSTLGNWVSITVVLPPPYDAVTMADALVRAWDLQRNHAWEFDRERIRAAALEVAAAADPEGGLTSSKLAFEPWQLEVSVNRLPVSYPHPVGQIHVEVATE